MNRKKIKIRHDEGLLCLPLNENGNLSLTVLKQYFPNAQALTFIDNGQKCGLDVVLGDIIINPAVDSYNVHVVEDASGPNIITERKKRIVHDILGHIEKKKKQNPHSETSINSKMIDTEKSLKILNIMKSIHIGWLHKTSAAGKYMQIKKPSVGSIPLKLQLSCHYSVDDIKTLAMNEFLAKCKSTSLDNLKLTSFEHLNVFLGTFNGTIVSSFSKDDKDCGFWHYFKQQKLPPSRIHLYLLTSPKDQSSSNINMEVKSIKVLTEKSFLENKKENLSITPHTDTKQSVLITKSPLHEQNAVSIPQSSNGTSKILDDIKFLYEYLRESKYSKDLSIFHLEKMDLHSSELENINFTSIEEFEPLNFGYRISSIIMNNKVLLNILMDESFKREYTFPSAEIINDNRHYIIYDVNDFNGIYDGKYGVGVISNCIVTCQPWFTWYEDNKVVKAGKFFYWLSDVKESCTYKCVINCGFNSSPITTNDYKTTTKFNSLFCTSDKTSTDVLPNDNIIQNSPGDISIPLIQRKEIEIFKTLLGAGAQGKVRKGRWLGTNVAVKTMEISEANSKATYREITILERVRHPNIIQVMAYCIEAKLFHIVTELFDNTCLADVLFDKETKEEYNLTLSMKNHIAHQICQALNYLHLQENPIIHGDIKPANVLINSREFVKLCELGLSKFKKMVTRLKSTLGHAKSVKGTPLYMAPEILLQNMEANIYSDIWAMACTLIELYSEKSIWTVDDEDSLTLVLKNETVPDLLAVPQDMKSIITKCFEYHPKCRPAIFDILNLYSKS